MKQVSNMVDQLSEQTVTPCFGTVTGQIGDAN